MAKWNVPVLLPADPTNSLEAATKQYVDNGLATKAPANNATLTGVPTAPTAAAATNTTQIATTAFVQAAVAGVSGGTPSNMVTTDTVQNIAGDKTFDGISTFTGQDGVATLIASHTSDLASGSQNLYLRRRTTAGAVSAGYRLGGVIAQGYYSGSAWNSPIAIEFYTEEAFTSSAAGSYIQFATTAPGSTTRTARWAVTGAGHLTPADGTQSYDLGLSTKRVRTGYFGTIDANALTLNNNLTGPLTWNNNVTMIQMAGGGKIVAGAAGYSVIVRPGANDATVAGVLSLAVQGFDNSVRFSVPEGLTNPVVVAHSSMTIAGNTVWHAGNDGAGSTLDADQLDGQHGAFYQNAANLNAGTIPAARMPALTGDVTTVAGAVAATIANGAVTLPKMANLAANSFIGNNTGAAATPIALTGAQAKTLLALVKGDVGLGNVDNTSDANKPVSTATQTALNGKADYADTYVFKGLIPNAVDLNTYTTTGIYFQNSNAQAGAGTNYPVALAGRLTVFTNGSFTWQEYSVYSTNSTYRRTLYTTTWSPWYEIWDSRNFDPTTKANTASPTFTGTVGMDGVTVNIGTTGSLNFGSAVRQMLNLYGTTFGIGVQNSTLYYRTGSAASGFAWFQGGVHSATQNDPGAGGVTLMTLDNAGNLGVSAQLNAATADITGQATVGNLLADNGNITTTSANGRGFGFWGNQNTYGISMSSAADATYGGRVAGETTSDYNMYFRMTGGTNRGFVFWNGAAGAGSAVAGIDGAGNVRAAGIVDATRFTAGYDSTIANSFNCTGWFRSSGASGWYNATYGSGIYMTDTSYVKTYSAGNKPMMASDFVISSDVRLKTAITDLRFKGRLRPVNYVWKRTGEADIGFIAQEVEQLYPEVIGRTDDEDGNERLVLSYPRLTAVISHQVNRVEDEVEALKAKVEAQQNQINDQQQQIDELRKLIEQHLAK